MTTNNIFEIVLVAVFVSIVTLHVIRLVTAFKSMKALQEASKRIRERSEVITGPADPSFNQRPFQEAMWNASIMNQSGGERMMAQFNSTMDNLNRLQRETMITTATNLSSPHFSALAEEVRRVEYQRSHARSQAVTEAHQEFVIQQATNYANRMALVDRTAIKEAYAQSPKKKEKPIEKPETRSAMQHIQLGDE